jgi:hypothetical protein
MALRQNLADKDQRALAKTLAALNASDVKGALTFDACFGLARVITVYILIRGSSLSNPAPTGTDRHAPSAVTGGTAAM